MEAFAFGKGLNLEKSLLPCVEFFGDFVNLIKLTLVRDIQQKFHLICLLKCKVDV